MKKLLMIGLSLMIILSLAACTKNEDDKKDDASQKILSDIISDNRDKELNDSMGIITSKDDKDSELTFSMLEIDESDLSEYAISLSPMNINAYCVAIVKPAEGKKDTVKKAFEEYKTNQENVFEPYLQDQYKIAQDTVITEVGDYIVFAMCENSSTFRDNVVKELK